MGSDAAPDHLVVRDDDPRIPGLEASGYTVVGRSWGARLCLADGFDAAPYRQLIARAEVSGYHVLELDASRAPQLLALEAETRGDYPFTPATPARAWTLAELSALWADGARVFGAVAASRSDDAVAELAGATIVTAEGDRAETESTSVRRAHRGRGIGAALKAASILALAEDGIRTFGTGGAAANTASIAMNRAAGYEITESWLSFAPPARSSAQ